MDRGYWPQRRAVLCVEMRLLVDWSGNSFHLKMSGKIGNGGGKETEVPGEQHRAPALITVVI